MSAAVLVSPKDSTHHLGVPTGMSAVELGGKKLLTTVKPSNTVTTVKPSNTVTTLKPSNTVTTVKPSNTVTTVKPSNTVTTVKPSNAVTTVKPSGSAGYVPDWKKPRSGPRMCEAVSVNPENTGNYVSAFRKQFPFLLSTDPTLFPQGEKMGILNIITNTLMQLEDPCLPILTG